MSEQDERKNERIRKTIEWLSQPELKEPSITVNGTELTMSQAMTMRDALETFALTLEKEGLGKDETGKNICKGYLARIDEIRKLIFKR